MIKINKKNIIIAIFILSLIVNGSLIGGYFFLKVEINKAREIIAQKQEHKNVADFALLFIEKVLKSEKDVSFEDRLTLETAVRDLNDKEILDQWRKFTESKVKEDAQKEVKNLLELLLKKVSVCPVCSN